MACISPRPVAEHSCTIRWQLSRGQNSAVLPETLIGDPLKFRKLVRQVCEDNGVQTDMSALKMVLMSEDLPESRCDEVCISSA